MACGSAHSCRAPPATLPPACRRLRNASQQTPGSLTCMASSGTSRLPTTSCELLEGAAICPGAPSALLPSPLLPSVPAAAAICSPAPCTASAAVCRPLPTACTATPAACATPAAACRAPPAAACPASSTPAAGSPDADGGNMDACVVTPLLGASSASAAEAVTAPDTSSGGWLPAGATREPTPARLLGALAMRAVGGCCRAMRACSRCGGGKQRAHVSRWPDQRHNCGPSENRLLEQTCAWPGQAAQLFCT